MTLGLCQDHYYAMRLAMAWPAKPGATPHAAPIVRQAPPIATLPIPRVGQLLGRVGQGVGRQRRSKDAHQLGDLGATSSRARRRRRCQQRSQRPRRRPSACPQSLLRVLDGELFDRLEPAMLGQHGARRRRASACPASCAPCCPSPSPRVGHGLLQQSRAPRGRLARASGGRERPPKPVHDLRRRLLAAALHLARDVLLEPAMVLVARPSKRHFMANAVLRCYM